LFNLLPKTTNIYVIQSITFIFHVFSILTIPRHCNMMHHGPMFLVLTFIVLLILVQEWIWQNALCNSSDCLQWHLLQIPNCSIIIMLFMCCILVSYVIESSSIILNIHHIFMSFMNFLQNLIFLCSLTRLYL
jgi:hypothetical protein